jgi:predicted small secreted protein
LLYGPVARLSAGSIFVIQIERDAMWKKALFVLMSLLSLSLTACNTVSGAGQDLSAAGHAVTEEAQEHKRY